MHRYPKNAPKKPNPPSPIPIQIHILPIYPPLTLAANQTMRRKYCATKLSV